MSLGLLLNGKARQVEGLTAGATLAEVLEGLELRADRIAVELNGEIAPRRQWAEILVAEGDKVEVVHFVGGGAGR